MSGIHQALLASGPGRKAISVTISANTTDYTLTASSLSGYQSGKTDVTFTVDTGVYLYSTATGTPALSVTGFASGDTLTIVNKGFILGRGGVGGGYASANGSAGGNAINLTFAATINNSDAAAYIAGGGGGGGAAYGVFKSANIWAGGGGGAGAGDGGPASATIAGGAGGGVGAAGANGAGDTTSVTGGGGGGRILPGTGGSAVLNQSGRGGGAGGSGASYSFNSTGISGAGGSGSSAGGTATASTASSWVHGGGGGGWGASGGAGRGSTTNYTAGAGGKAVNLNGNTVTWTSGDTTRVYGAVS